MEGTKSEAAESAGVKRAHWWVGLLWLAYLAWALPSFAAQYWPLLTHRNS